MSDIFQRHILGQPWQPTKKDILLDELAQLYEDHCEAFDRRVCTGPIKNGRILPANGREAGIINRNAMTFRATFLKHHPGVSVKEFQEALRRHYARR